MKEKYQIRYNGYQYAIWGKGFLWWRKMFYNAHSSEHRTFDTLEEAQKMLDDYILSQKAAHSPYDKVVSEKYN